MLRKKKGVRPTDKLREILKILQDERRQEEYIKDIDESAAPPTLIEPNYFSRWQTGVVPSAENLGVLLKECECHFGFQLPTPLRKQIGRIRELAGREHKFWRLFGLPKPSQIDRISDCQSFLYEDNESKVYSYRLVRDRSQLNEFVRLTDEDDNIRTDEKLDRKGRLALYSKWYEWSPKSFLSLWRRDPKASTGEIIEGISVVLPISKTSELRLWKGEIRNVDLEHREMLALDHNPSRLLIDIWLLTSKALLKSGGHGHCLIPLHISLFWDGNAPLTILAEPVNDVTLEYCYLMGLQGNEQGSGFRLHNDIGTGCRPEAWGRFQQSVEAVRSWPVHSPERHRHPSNYE